MFCEGPDTEQLNLLFPIQLQSKEAGLRIAQSFVPLFDLAPQIGMALVHPSMPLHGVEPPPIAT